MYVQQHRERRERRDEPECRAVAVSNADAQAARPHGQHAAVEAAGAEQSSSAASAAASAQRRQSMEQQCLALECFHRRFHCIGSRHAGSLRQHAMRALSSARGGGGAGASRVLRRCPRHQRQRPPPRSDTAATCTRGAVTARGNLLQQLQPRLQQQEPVNWQRSTPSSPCSAVALPCPPASHDSSPPTVRGTT